MAKKKTLEELQALHREKMQENRDREKKRKQRTRRLIQFGAVAETFVSGAETMTAEEFKKALSSLIAGTGV